MLEAIPASLRPQFDETSSKVENISLTQTGMDLKIDAPNSRMAAINDRLDRTGRAIADLTDMWAFLKAFKGHKFIQQGEMLFHLIDNTVSEHVLGRRISAARSVLIAELKKKNILGEQPARGDLLNAVSIEAGLPALDIRFAEFPRDIGYSARWWVGPKEAQGQ
ncbi:unnamed protein product, partial [Prorocentrum cordatum]